MRTVRKVLLINPPNTILKDSVRRIGEPIGLLYIGAMLKKHGYEVCVFDMTCEGYWNITDNNNRITYGSSLDDLEKKLNKEQPDVVGVNCMFSAREENVRSICKHTKLIMPEIVTVIGGLHPSLFAKELLGYSYIDYIIIGEGEYRFIKLIEAISKGVSPNFDGVAYKIKSDIIVNPMTTRINNLDAIPFPDRSLVNMEVYHDIGVPYAPFSIEKRVAQVLATRGCPNNCNFCSTVSYWGHKLRIRSPDNVISEIQELVDKYDIKEIQFVDDNLTMNKPFAKELFLKLKPFNLKFCTPHGLYFNSLDNELIGLMADAGAYQLTFAVESASDRVLRDIIQKKVNLSKIKTIVEEAHKYDIGVHGMFVLGLPGESREEILQSLEFPYSVGFDSVSFFIANPMPGSRLFNECIEKGYLIDKSNFSDFKSINIRIPVDSVDYHMDYNELDTLIDQKIREYNDWASNQFPERASRKFKRFISANQDQKHLILGRVT